MGRALADRLTATDRLGGSTLRDITAVAVSPLRTPFDSHATIDTAAANCRMPSRCWSLETVIGRRPPFPSPLAFSVEEALCQRTNEHSFRSEEHTSELQSLMRISYAVFCLKKKITSFRRTTIS